MTNKKLFRVSAKKIFITISSLKKGSFSLEQIKNSIINAEKTPILTGYVSEEDHKKGTIHFHILLIFAKNKNIINPKYFNYICNKQTHFKTATKPKSLISYITKKHNYTAWGDDIQQLPIEFYRELIREKLEDKNTLPQDLFQHSDPHINKVIYQDSYKLDYYSKRFRAFTMQKHLKSKKILKFWDIPAITRGPSQFQPYIQQILPILHFMNQHTNQRRYKSPNLLISSQLPNMGKSSLYNLIHDNSPCYTWPTDNWYELYHDDTYQFLIWDELSFTGQAESFLKLLFAGHSLQLPIKGSQVFKTDNPLILTASNFNLKQLTRKRYRFKCVCDPALLNTPLCSHTSQCKPTQEANIFYSTMAARIHQIQLTQPIFPHHSDQPDLWELYYTFLNQHYIT